MANEDFDYTMGEGEPQPKKGFMGGIFTKKEKPVNIQQRSRNMPQQQLSPDIMKLLGGAYKEPDDQNMALDYVGNSYVPIGETYKPIHSTFKENDYVTPEYEPFKYESPQYQSQSAKLFGGEQNKEWESSPVFAPTGVGDNLYTNQEKSIVFTPTGVGESLFGGKPTPALSPETQRPEEFPVKLPPGSTMPFQRVTPVNQFTPNPPPVFNPQMVSNVPVMPVQNVQPVTLPTQVYPPQYMPPQGVKRPVGRPRLNRPPKPKRPVGRPRKNVESVQMVESQ